MTPRGIFPAGRRRGKKEKEEEGEGRLRMKFVTTDRAILATKSEPPAG